MKLEALFGKIGLALLLPLVVATGAATAIEISQMPVESYIKDAPPTLMFLLDDSGSMDAEMMMAEGEGGTFWYEGSDYGWLFDDPYDDNTYSTGYSLLTDGYRMFWQTQCARFNTIYYDPEMTYAPWPATRDFNYVITDARNPRYQPDKQGTCDLQGLYYKLEGTGWGPVDIRIAHYYRWSESDNCAYLINLDGHITYYKVQATAGPLLGHDELTQVATAAVPDDVRLPANRTYDQELKNFATWFSFYRKRVFVGKAAVMNAIKGLSGIRVGVYSLNHDSYEMPDGTISNNNGIVLPARDVGVMRNGQVVDQTDDILNALYRLNAEGATPLRSGLNDVGKYFDTQQSSVIKGANPYAAEANGGGCQQAFAIVITDGYWNSENGPGVGNADGSQASPFADTYSDTLADVAMYYYKTDLATDLPDDVPNTSEKTPCDTATHQHMVTYTVSFGMEGTLSLSDYLDDENNWLDPCFADNAPNWPQPERGEQTTIDDLMHAAVNGRGQYFSAKNPKTLSDSLKAVMQHISNRLKSGSSVAVSGQSLQTDQTLYQAFFRGSDWSGNLKKTTVSKEVNADTGAISAKFTDVWDAGSNISMDAHESRVIVTWDTEQKKGVPFRTVNLNAAMMDRLDPINPKKYLDFLRGKSDPTLRERSTPLGDFINSGPTLGPSMDPTARVGNTVFVGGNDGMLHAFNTEDGTERFAYIPGLVFDNLKRLSRKDYSHTCYVDATPQLLKMDDHAYMVGGLGRGGKGYYCLDVTTADAMKTETDVAAAIKWECTDALMGYTYSRPILLETRCETTPWVIVAGNGYNCEAGVARLMVINAQTGDVINRIAVDDDIADNGLSTPVVTETGDKAYIAYAGDVKGHIWKFDLTEEDPRSWKKAYRLFTTGEMTDPKPVAPILTEPEVMRACDSREGYMVLFGTGKLLHENDLTDSTPQYIYGIWDHGSTVAGHDRLMAQTIISTQTHTAGKVVRMFSNNAMDWYDSDTNSSGKEGWFVKLPGNNNPEDPAERVLEDIRIQVRNGRVNGISFTPNNAPCKGGGSSFVYRMNACTGGRVAGFEAQFDVNEDGRIDDADLTAVPIDVGDGMDAAEFLRYYGDSGDFEKLSVNGEIDEGSLSTVLSGKMLADYAALGITLPFSIWDRDGNGVISHDDLALFFSSVPMVPTGVQFDGMLHTPARLSVNTDYELNIYSTTGSDDIVTMLTRDPLDQGIVCWRELTN
ncbi:MAG: hypothetical protein CSA22_06970 [Deltaproteobacteria bacterium]|nr:MAG: hypothetical protein CSA22_06970 [Deltaproteobacteria bacterium]